MTNANHNSLHRPFARIREFAPPLVILVAALIVWEITVRIFKVPTFLFPAPQQILLTLWEKRSALAIDFGVTLVEAVLGFLLANSLSLAVGIGFFYSRTAERTLLPLLVGLKSIPVIAISPLLVLWFGYGLSGKVMMASTVAFFPLVVGTITGIRATSVEALDLMRSLSATRWETARKLCLPNAAPHILAALKVSSTLAVVGAIVAEMSGARRGLGFTILMSSYNVDTPMLFAAIVLSAACGGIVYALVIILELVMRRSHLVPKI